MKQIYSNLNHKPSLTDSDNPDKNPSVVTLNGRSLLAPRSAFARAVVMGNGASTDSKEENTDRRTQNRQAEQKPVISNLTRLLNQKEPGSPHHEVATGRVQEVDEADSASGAPVRLLGTSAPLLSHHQAYNAFLPLSRQNSTPGEVVVAPQTLEASPFISSDKVRRCMSSKELKTLAPPSGSPYAYMLNKKEEIEISMRQRLHSMKEALSDNLPKSEDSSSCSSRRRETSNAERNRKRALHAKAVVDDLCHVVADLFVAESKLLNPSSYGVVPQRPNSDQREPLLKSIHNFVSALPLRYALGADTPSEVLLHMRLMAAVRSERTKAAVHIHNLNHDSRWNVHAESVAQQKSNRSLRLVTISCHDAVGLLEYISKLLATGGSRVLDADVMLSKGGIVLDRFVVEMNGRLRLDTLTNLIEAFLRRSSSFEQEESSAESTPEKKKINSPPVAPKGPSGPLYYREETRAREPSRNFQQEMESAVPLSRVLASSQADLVQVPSFPKLQKCPSMPGHSTSLPVPDVQLVMRPPPAQLPVPSPPTAPNKVSSSTRQKRPLVNRRGSSNLDDFSSVNDGPALDYVTIPAPESANGSMVEDRAVPLIPFEEIMLIETIGAGRVSTIYRAAWQRSHQRDANTPLGVQMVALKVAMVNATSGDVAHVDEVRREADIAARLEHPNICSLVGVAADSECFCLAYDFCEGGSLLSLLTDSSRYYEYLPIALDVANGMAYLHSRNVIHRDLKPSNILLTRDHRAKIADFGMSIANAGQELTAETGTYRYMAPEVIRHESYSSNADVYSFGICLWQLITREIPFARMTPIQAAYAVAEGRRPPIPASTPLRLKEIITACWDEDSHKRPSFTYIAMALADYAKMAFSPANVGALTLQIANEMLATVEGNSTVNVDFSTPVDVGAPAGYVDFGLSSSLNDGGSDHSNIGLQIE